MEKPDKVLIISYYWPPSGGPGVQRWLKFTKYLTEMGFSCYVITVDPKKASYAVTDASLLNEVNEDVTVIKTKTCEPYKMYQRLTGKKEIPYSGFVNEKKPGFLQKMSRFVRGNLFIPDSRKGWNKYAYKAAKHLIETEKIQTVITTSPPHSTQLTGLKLKKTFNIRWIADIRDPWTDIYYYKEMLHTRWAARKDAALERKVLEAADDVVVVSQNIRRQFAEKSAAIKVNKIHILPNGFDAGDFEHNFYVSPHEVFTIAYTGTLAESYHPEAFINAVNRISEQRRIAFVLAGNISESVADKFNKGILDLKGYISHKQSIELICNAHALFLAIPDVTGNEGILTGKLFEYLAAGKPVIAIGPVAGDAAAILKDEQAGNMYGYNDEEGIYQFLNEIINGKIQTSPSATYSRQALAVRMAEIIRNGRKHDE